MANHSKYMPLNKFLQQRYVPFCMFHSDFKVKRQVSGTTTLVQYINLARFFYVGKGTYCCVFITLLQVHIVGCS